MYSASTWRLMWCKHRGFRLLSLGLRKVLQISKKLVEYQLILISVGPFLASVFTYGNKRSRSFINIKIQFQYTCMAFQSLTHFNNSRDSSQIGLSCLVLSVWVRILTYWCYCIYGAWTVCDTITGSFACSHSSFLRQRIAQESRC